MNPNMSIYRRLNSRLLVQAELGLGLLHWANICLIYISNTLPQTQGGSSMKTWSWISMRRSLGDAVKNAFKETTMKNMPIDRFRSLKCRNEAQNQNLCKKLSKIGPFRNFDFWSKINTKSQSQRILVKSTVRAHGSNPNGPGRVGQVNSQLGDVVLTRRHCWRVWWRGLRHAWHADVDRWRQMTSAEVFNAWQARGCSTGV